MAKASIERHPAVLQTDLPGIYAQIAQDDLATAERVIEALNATFEQIANQPECGVVYRTRNRRLQSVRMLPVTGFSNYLVFYGVEGPTIRILYVVHGARHLVRLFRREPRS